MKLRNKIFLIVAITLLIIAVLLIAIGYAIIGADIIGRFSSRYAMWVYLGVGIFFLVWAGLELTERIKKL